MEAGISRVVVAETETRSEEVLEAPEATTDPARVLTAAAAPPAWDPEVGDPEVEADAEAEGGADDRRFIGEESSGR